MRDLQPNLFYNRNVVEFRDGLISQIRPGGTFWQVVKFIHALKNIVFVKSEKLLYVPVCTQYESQQKALIG